MDFLISSNKGENDEFDAEEELDDLHCESRFERVKFQEHFFVNNSLLCLIRALVGKKTTVELRNELAVHGTIVHVDYYMAVAMDNCTVSHVLSGKQLRTAAQMRLSGSKIRYVHIPEDVDVRGTISSVLAPEKPKRAIKAARRLRKDKDRHLRQNEQKDQQQQEEEPPAQIQGPKIFEKRREVDMGESELSVQDVLKMLNIADS